MNRRSRSVMEEEDEKRRNSSVDLPEDLVVEILSRVPAVSVARFRSTSKGWNSLIGDGRLAEKHSANAPKPPSLIIRLIGFRVYLATFDLRAIHGNFVKLTSQITLKDHLSNSSEEVDIRKVFHCDGLLLCTTKDNRLMVWNPCSGETTWIQLENPWNESDIYALGKSSCNKYKILRISQYFNMVEQCLVEYEIYDFTSSSWRCVGETGDWSIQWMHRGGASANGNTYWLASKTPFQDFPNDILLSFDFSTERFVNVSVPDDGHFFALSVTREEQRLCMLAYSSVVVIDVWMATKIESSGAASWSKFLSVQEQAFIDNYLFWYDGMNFLADFDNKVIVCRGNHWVYNGVLTIVGEDTRIQVDHDDVVSQCSLLSYVPALARIQKGSLGARKAPNK